MTQYSTVRKSRFFSTRFSQGVWKSVCLFGFTAWKYSGKRKKCFFLRVEKAWKRFIFNSFSTYMWGKRKTSAKIGTKACGFRNDGQLFFFEKKVAKKGKNPCRIYRALSVRGKARKSAPLPAVMLTSFLVNIRRNREARECFTDFLWSANAL